MPGVKSLAIVVLCASIQCVLVAPAFSQSLTADDLPLPLGAYRIADGVVGPVPLQKVAPDYSREAALIGLEGTVIVTGVIEQDGSQRDMRVTRPLGFGLDEKALEAIAKWKFVPATYTSQPIPVFASFAIDFRLPSRQSRWHLTEAAFAPAEGVSAPVFKTVIWPIGAGIGPDAIEEGQLVGASGRTANATLQFDVDDRGLPIHFNVRKSSADVWGSEAIRLLSTWRFKPGVKQGKPTSVPCTFTFAWGPRTLQASKEAEKSYVTNAAVLAPSFPATGGIHPPIIFQTPPIYPADARIDRVEGTVVISLVVDEVGRPRDLRVIEPLGHALDEAAVAAVSDWKFRPMLLNGQAAAVPATVRVDFRLGVLPRPRKAR